MEDSNTAPSPLLGLSSPADPHSNAACETPSAFVHLNVQSN